MSHDCSQQLTSSAEMSLRHFQALRRRLDLRPPSTGAFSVCWIGRFSQRTPGRRPLPPNSSRKRTKSRSGFPGMWPAKNARRCSCLPNSLRMTTPPWQNSFSHGSERWRRRSYRFFVRNGPRVKGFEAYSQGVAWLRLGDVGEAKTALSEAFSIFEGFNIAWRAALCASALYEVTNDHRWMQRAIQKIEPWPRSWIARRVADGTNAAALRLHRVPPAQRQVLELARAGKRNSEIASALGRSPHTVRNQLSDLFTTLRQEPRRARRRSLEAGRCLDGGPSETAPQLTSRRRLFRRRSDTWARSFRRAFSPTFMEGGMVGVKP